MSAQPNPMRDLRKAHDAELKRNKQLRRRLEELEAREAVETKMRVAYFMAKDAQFPDEGREFMQRIREHPTWPLKEVYNILRESYAFRGTLKEESDD